MNKQNQRQPLLVWLTQNVRGYAASTRHQWLGGFRLYHDGQAPDLIMMQETHIGTPDQAQYARAQYARSWGFKHTNEDGTPRSYWSHGSKAAAGVAILIAPHSKLTKTKPHMETHWTTRWIAIQATLDNEAVIIVCCYGPNDAKPREHLYQTMRRHLKDATKVYVGGDFNCTQAAADRSHTQAHHQRSHQLDLIAQEHGLVDALEVYGTVKDQRKAGREQHTYRYKGPNGSQRSSRLDRWYIPAPEQKWRVQVTAVVPSQVADHDGSMLSIVDMSRAPRARPEPKLYHGRGFIGDSQTESIRIYLDTMEARLRAAQPGAEQLELWDSGKLEMQALLISRKKEARPA